MKCLFCDQNNIEFVEVDTSTGTIAVQCLDCGMTGPAGETDEDAIMFWEAIEIIQMGNPTRKYLTEYIASLPKLTEHERDLVISTWVTAFRKSREEQ